MGPCFTARDLAYAHLCYAEVIRYNPLKLALGQSAPDFKHVARRQFRSTDFTAFLQRGRLVPTALDSVMYVLQLRPWFQMQSVDAKRGITFVPDNDSVDVGEIKTVRFRERDAVR
jgi:hypothetical protein